MKKSLPIDSHLKSILAKLAEHQSLVLTSPPGTGKTTRLPPVLLSLTSGCILILVPKKIAAIMAAQRIAQEQCWTLGQEVGYMIRFDNKTSPQTRILFSTEGVFQKLVIEDPELKRFTLIVFDEFHERALNTDIALAYCRELQELSRPDLKLIVMSATINERALVNYLGPGSQAYAITSEVHNLISENSKDSQKIICDEVFYKKLIQQIKMTLLDPRSQGHILVFLPGAREIQKSMELAKNSILDPGIKLYPLHSQISIEDQQNILREQSHWRKIIFCTNIAESSITVDGVDTVIDSGLQKQVRFNLKTETEVLELKKISLFSSRQRAGRAHRQKEGLYLKLWNRQDELSFLQEDPPEVQRTDLSAGLLFLASQNILDFKNFSWYEKPDSFLLNWSTHFLKQLELIDKNHRLTSLGQALLKLPLDIRWALFGILATGQGLAQEAALTLALFEQVAQKNTFGSLNFDEILQSFLKNDNTVDLFKIKEHFYLQRSYQQFYQILNRLHLTATPKQDLHQIWLLAFRDRLVKKRSGSALQGILASGKGVEIAQKNTSFKEGFFIALELRENTHSNSLICDLFLPVPENIVLEALKNQIVQKESIEFDEVKKSFFKIRSQSFEKIILNETQKIPLKENEFLPLWQDWVEHNQNYVLNNNLNLKAWLHRLLLLAGWSQEENKNLDQGLQYLDELGYFSTPVREVWQNLAHAFSKIEDLLSPAALDFFKSAVPRDILKKLDQKLPTAWTLYYGRTFYIDYSDIKKPLLEARIQDLLGVKEVPAILDGQLKLTFILLGPHKRAVQITQDLLGFWQGSYHQVRKELRGDYPRHAWPEDPLNYIVIPKPPKK